MFAVGACSDKPPGGVHGKAECRNGRNQESERQPGAAKRQGAFTPWSRCVAQQSTLPLSPRPVHAPMRVNAGRAWSNWLLVWSSTLPQKGRRVWRGIQCMLWSTPVVVASREAEWDVMSTQTSCPSSGGGRCGCWGGHRLLRRSPSKAACSAPRRCGWRAGRDGG